MLKFTRRTTGNFVTTIESGVHLTTRSNILIGAFIMVWHQSNCAGTRFPALGYGMPFVSKILLTMCKPLHWIYKTFFFMNKTQSWKVQGRLLGKGLVLFLHHGGWFYMHFARWIQTIYWRTSLRRVEAKYFYRNLEAVDRLLALSERICREFVFFLRIFESRNCDIREDITELIKQLLKLYEGLTERYRERVNWLEEDRDDNSFRCQPESVDEGNARSRGRPRFSISKSQIEALRDLGLSGQRLLQWLVCLE